MRVDPITPAAGADEHRAGRQRAVNQVEGLMVVPAVKPKSATVGVPARFATSIMIPFKPWE